MIVKCPGDIFRLFFSNRMNCSLSFHHLLFDLDIISVHDGTQLLQRHCVFMCVCLLNRIMGTSTLPCFKGKTISVQINISAVLNLSSAHINDIPKTYMSHDRSPFVYMHQAWACHCKQEAESVAYWQ